MYWQYKDFIEGSLCSCGDNITHLFYVVGYNILYVVNWDLRIFSFDE